MTAGQAAHPSHSRQFGGYLAGRSNHDANLVTRVLA